jgi:hypothetical protein
MELKKYTLLEELQKKRRDDAELIYIEDYVEKYGNGLTVQAVRYAVDHDLLDHVVIELRKKKIKVIVMTDKSRAYSPNNSPKRAIMEA